MTGPPTGARSRILDVAMRVIFPIVLLVSVYLLVAGHNRPGGGFAGGLVAGAAFVLAFVARGPDECRRLLPVAPETLLGTGMLLATVTALAPLPFGGEVLESGVLEVDLPLFGTVKAYSVLVFDTGIFLVVLGLVSLVISRLGRAGAR